jgi:hypothetical protein
MLATLQSDEFSHRLPGQAMAGARLRPAKCQNLCLRGITRASPQELKRRPEIIEDDLDDVDIGVEDRHADVELRDHEGPARKIAV